MKVEYGSLATGEFLELHDEIQKMVRKRKRQEASRRITKELRKGGN
jgi:hypothetical protein